MSTLEIGLPQLCSVTEMAPITLLRVNTTHASSLQSVHYRCVCLYFIGREGVVLRFFVGFDWLATQARLIRGCFSFSQLFMGRRFLFSLLAHFPLPLTHPISSSLLKFQHGMFASKNIRAPEENACTGS